MIQIECLPNQGLNWQSTMISLRNVYVGGDILLNEQSVCASRIILSNTNISSFYNIGLAYRM